MYNFPFGYQPIEPSTWAYLSSLLMLALFFKFNRFWSFRNFDLFLLILLAPGLLMVHYGEVLERNDQRVRQVASRMVIEQEGHQLDSSSHAELVADEESAETDLTEPKVLSRFQHLQRMGYLWLFGAGLIWLIRLLYDPLIKRKPLLEPNLSIGGLVFLGCSLMIFLFANVLTSSPRDLSGPKGAAQLYQRMSSRSGQNLKNYGPGYPLLHLIPAIPTFVDKELSPDVDAPSDDLPPVESGVSTPEQRVFSDVARITAILSQIAIVVGLILIGYRHFGSFQMGVGMATIFLMLPYTAQFAGDTMHLLPGALLVWSIASFRRPWVSGILIGLAAGVCYYPFFLLPLWISFYWERGRTRFTLGAILAIVVVVSTLVFTSVDYHGFVKQLQSIFGFWWPRTTDLNGVWALNWEHWFRLPFLVAFIVLCISYVFWPVTKNLASLISCSAAAMVAVQFWHGDGGGLYLAWYVPLVLLVIFRPNLDDQIATSVLDKPRRIPPKTESPNVVSAA